MPRLIIDPEARPHTGTRRFRNDSIWDGTVEFDAETGASQDLDAEIAEQFADRYETFLHEDDLSEEELASAPALDDIDALLDGTVDEVADALETGEYDDRLDEIERRADRQGVQAAIEDRRDGLEAAD